MWKRDTGEPSCREFVVFTRNIARINKARARPHHLGLATGPETQAIGIPRCEETNSPWVRCARDWPPDAAALDADESADDDVLEEPYFEEDGDLYAPAAYEEALPAILLPGLLLAEPGEARAPPAEDPLMPRSFRAYCVDMFYLCLCASLSLSLSLSLYTCVCVRVVCVCVCVSDRIRLCFSCGFRAL